MPVTYHITWPTDVPELRLGQTLTLATHGLPDIWNQLSVAVEYDQSYRTNSLSSVTLFDPLVGYGTNLDRAARAGVFVHAQAGDLAARRGERGLLASDVLDQVRACVNPDCS